MSPAQEFIVKMIIGAVMLSALSSATYLVGLLVLSILPGNNAVAAASALAFFLVGFIYVASWISRQVSQWWDS